jgi:hypothetical protein
MQGIEWIAKKKAEGTYDGIKLSGYLLAYSKTLEWYKEQLRLQGGVCAICKQPPTEGPKGRLTVDHDHACCPAHRSCGTCVRGLICQHCNLVLGHSKDSTVTLLSAVQYLSTFATGPTTTERGNLEKGCDSLNSCESMREESEAVLPLVN